MRDRRCVIDNRRSGLVSIRLRNIVNIYVLYLLITTISRFAIVRKSDIYLHINEFIMPVVVQIYIKSTINSSILSKSIPLIMRFIPLIKRCLCIFLLISRVYLQSWIQSVGMTMQTYTRFTQLMVYTTRVALTTASFFFYYVYTVYTVSDERKLNIKRYM